MQLLASNRPLYDATVRLYHIVSCCPPGVQVLASNSFLYDATIMEYWANYSTTSPNASYALWPYTMDDGIVQARD